MSVASSLRAPVALMVLTFVGCAAPDAEIADVAEPDGVLIGDAASGPQPDIDVPTLDTVAPVDTTGSDLVDSAGDLEVSQAADDISEVEPDSVVPDTQAPEPIEPPRVDLTTPASGTAVVAGTEVRFEATTNCFPAQVTFWADDRFKFGEFAITQGNFSLNYAFNTPGVNRDIRVDVTGLSGCEASDEVLITVQAAFDTGLETLTDTNGNAFTVRWARLPTADAEHDLVVTGSNAAKTVRNLAVAIPDARAAVNGGYFAFGQGPVSYAKGRLGYESPSGNVKGPRGCFWYDRERRLAGLTVSMGREYVSGGWGAGLFPEATDVICAGPTLVRDGVNVFAQQYDAENFGTSGISPSSPLPRTAICVLEDGGIFLLAAQHDSVKARGFTLPALAAYLIGKGCAQALNLDGGGSSAFWSTEGYWEGSEDRPLYNAVVVR
jgi:hypothetical protein